MGWFCPPRHPPRLPSKPWLHRLSLLLTVLGIVFGVASVIAMLAIGEGASFEAQEQIKNLGSQNVILRSIKPPEEQKVTDRNSQSYVLQYGLTYRDVKRIQSTIPGVTVVIPWSNCSRLRLEHQPLVDADIMGTVPWYPEMRNHRIAKATLLQRWRNAVERANVCVIGAEMVENLFPPESPLGRDVRVGSDYYRVIGVMEPRGKTARSEETTDANKASAAARMFVPLETTKTRYGEAIVKQRSGEHRG